MSTLTKRYRELLEKELPGLPKHLPDYVEEFRVEVIDLDMLGLYPPNNGRSGVIGYHQFGTILFLNEKMEQVGRVGYRDLPPSRRSFLEWLVGDPKKTCEKFHETVEEAFKRLGCVSTTRFILFIEESRHTWAVLYRMP